MRTARGAAVLLSSQLLAGVAGVGKSHLLATLAREAALDVIHVSSAGLTPPAGRRREIVAQHSAVRFGLVQRCALRQCL